jgi:hypothetical protein
MHESRRRAATLAIAAAGVLAIYGCSERLEGGAGCPILCPGQNVQLHDTLDAAVALDTTLASYPAIGEEPQLLLVSRGDTLETRVIIRFDTLPTTYQPPNSPTSVPIEMVDSAKLEVRLQFPTPGPAEQTVTIEAYDVDTTLADGDAADTAAATMLPLFRPDRLIGSLTFQPADLTGEGSDNTARILIDNAYLFAKIQAKARLRVGLLIRAAESAELVLQGVKELRPQLLRFTVAVTGTDTSRVTTGPHSATPAERFIAQELSDFVIVAQKRPADTPPEVLTIGGVPGRRGYLRFNLPRGIVDSTSVVRATLVLTQYPNRLAARGPDSVSLYPQPVVASELVTDLQKAANLIVGGAAFRLDSLRLAPDDSGDVEIEVVGLLNVWRQTQPERASRALVLRLPAEGVGPDELYFYSTEAAVAVRPRLRIVYVPRLGFGLP